MNKIYLFLILIIAASACDEKEILIPDYEPPESDRVVLLEEFTGVRCPNCPDAQREIENLLELFSGNLIAVSVYTDELGTPFPDSKFDFRTDVGNELQDYIGLLLAKPGAAINRKTFPGQNDPFLINVGSWAGHISDELEDFAELSMEIDHFYNPFSRELELTVSFTPKSTIDHDLRIGLLLTESEIIDPQDDNEGKIEDYQHDHVLRTYLSHYSGDPVSGAPYVGGQTYSRDYSFTLPEEPGWWVADNMSMVAFVSDGSAQAKRVLQAAEEKLIQ